MLPFPRAVAATLLVFAPMLANAAPVARAGRPFLAYPEEVILLDGRTSEGQNLLYRWVQVGGPEVPLVDADTAQPRFSPDLPGRYSFELVVREGDENSTADVVDVVVLDPEVGTRFTETACASLPARRGLGLAAIGLLLGLFRRETRKR
jgi:hypothetical protein